MIKPAATTEELLLWARSTIIDVRPPDFVLGGYMRRWWVIPRNNHTNVYLHLLTGSDQEPDMHDHPSNNTSVILQGSYIEHTAAGSVLREAGETVVRRAEDAHRLEHVSDVVSLFTMGPVVREWGFHTPVGWVQWRAYLKSRGAMA